MSHSRSRRWTVGLVAVSVCGALSATSLANDNRHDWNCTSIPRTTCWAATGYHTFSKVVAINTASAYRKCVRMQDAFDGRLYVRNCYAATHVYGYTSDAGLRYPMEESGAGCCIYTHVAVGNDTDQYHGLRGAAWY